MQPQRGCTDLFRYIDWVLDLPDALNDQFLNDVYQLEKEKNVTYITYGERRGEKRGKELGEKLGEQQGLYKGVETALEIRFGAEGTALMADVRQIDDNPAIEKILHATKSAATVDDVRTLIAQLRSADDE